MTGNLIDGILDARHTAIEPLTGLRARDGVFVVSGNHELIFGYRSWMEHYASMGMIVDKNGDVVLERAGGRLTPADLSDLSVPAPDVRSGTSPPSSRPRPVASPSSCSTISLGRRRTRRGSAFPRNFPVIPTVG